MDVLCGFYSAVDVLWSLDVLIGMEGKDDGGVRWRGGMEPSRDGTERDGKVQG